MSLCEAGERKSELELVAWSSSFKLTQLDDGVFNWDLRQLTRSLTGHRRLGAHAGDGTGHFACRVHFERRNLMNWMERRGMSRCDN